MKVTCPFSGRLPPNRRPIQLVHLLSIYLLLNRIVRIETASLTASAPISTTPKNTKDKQVNRSNDRLLQDDDKQFVGVYPISSAGFEISHEIVAQHIDDPNDRPSTDQSAIQQQASGRRPFSQIRHRNCGVQQVSASRLAPLPSLSERHSLAFSKLVKSNLELQRNESNQQATGSTFKGVQSDHKMHRNRFYNFEAIAARRKSNSRRGKVVGGELAYDGEFPWTVSIRKFDAHHCGGVGGHLVVNVC